MRVRFDERGNNGAREDAIVLIHGLPTSIDVFDALLAALSLDGRTIRIHLPGYGDTEAVADGYDLGRVAEAIESVLLSSGVRTASWVGFSGGAWRVLDLALRGVVRTRRVVCLAGVASLSSAERDGFRQFAAALRAGQDLRPIAPTRFLSPARAQDPDAAARVSRWLDAVSPENLANELDAFAAAPDVIPRLSALRAPLLARTGELDVATPPAKAKEIVDAVPGAKLEIVPDAGHALLVEDDVETVRSIRAFLRG